MNRAASFPVLALIVYAPLAAGAIALVVFTGKGEYLDSALWGAAIGIVLMGATVAATQRWIEASQQAVMLLVMGGMLVRFLVVVGAGIFVRYVTTLNLLSFYAGLFYTYIIFQALEVYYFMIRFKKRL